MIRLLKTQTLFLLGSGARVINLAAAVPVVVLNWFADRDQLAPGKKGDNDPLEPRSW